MNTINKTDTQAIKWLKKEFPRGIALIYVNYNDRFEDMSDLQELLKSGYYDLDWTGDAEYETFSQVYKEYMEEFELEEISDEDQDEMREWMWENRTDDATQDLLKNTSDVLCYIETEDESYEDKSNLPELIAKYAKTDAQKKEIEYVINEQFYGAPVSFYFKLNPLDLFKIIHNNDSKNITIQGAFFSTIDRFQGSNWLGNEAIFDITMSKENFVKNFYLDKAKGNGYGWEQIAGQSNYDDAGIVTGCMKNAISINAETSEGAKRELELETNWDKTKKCTMFDMNYNRHIGPKNYTNDMPCGTKCEACGTFWID